MQSIYFYRYTSYILINYDYKIVTLNVFPSNYVELDDFAENHLTYRGTGSYTGTFDAIMCARGAVSYSLGHSYADIKVVLLTSTRAMQECFVKIIINHHLSLQLLIISKKH